ncbi:MAG: thiamine phosphate synthase [Sphingomonas sp.]|uniref:thiamine phosphate synthase n=1 Tax=Sphingomonas sp. TaxID=28214 RepID=UPI003F817CDF
MTDERLGDGLWTALKRLPRGSGVVFRHYATPAVERRTLFRRVVRIARARGLIVVRAGGRAGFGENGIHGAARGRGLRTAPAHDRREAVTALRRGAKVLFVSPVFGTRSHPGTKALGQKSARRIAQGLPTVAIALGGMDARRFRQLSGFDGWAAIDAWSARERAGAK